MVDEENKHEVRPQAQIPNPVGGGGSVEKKKKGKPKVEPSNDKPKYNFSAGPNLGGIFSNHHNPFKPKDKSGGPKSSSASIPGGPKSQVKNQSGSLFGGGPPSNTPGGQGGQKSPSITPGAPGG